MYDEFPPYDFIAVYVLVLIHVSFEEDHRANYYCAIVTEPRTGK